ncbi:BON1-associated protein 2-like [Salvia divinorum]|uniref:BON1-associated protein 2-like n=1 Tax=Salvia divinorum TaxID=28513 RepID=A0ABD1GHA4_SALDI
MAKKASPYVIEVTVISAEGLRPVKKSSHVVLRSDPFNTRTTGPDRDGGSYPAWNEKLQMELPAHARFLTVEAHSGSSLVGAANIPVSDFAAASLPLNYLSFLSYRLRDPRGAKNGILNLSVRVCRRPGPTGSSPEPWPGVPVTGGKPGVVVTGIPVGKINHV